MIRANVVVAPLNPRPTDAVLGSLTIIGAVTQGRLLVLSPHTIQ